jgi:hypothetical protein
MAVHLCGVAENIKISCGFNIVPTWHPLNAALSVRLAASTTRHCHNRSVVSRASMPVTGYAFAIKGAADA